MRTAALWILVAVWLSGCSTNKAETLQRKRLRGAIPATLEIAHPWDKDPRVLKVRIWVDDDFRAQHMRWKAPIEEQVDEANQFLVPALGLRLEVVGYEHWKARAGDRSMSEVLDALASTDPGEGVELVIGYISALSMASKSFASLGVARPFGKHLILRGFADVDEREMFARAFPKIGEGERDEVHEARRRHKQTAVLIHEVGHSFGLIHENTHGVLMNPSYDVEMNRISDRSREVIEIALAERLKPVNEQDKYALAREMLAFLEANPWGGAIEVELAERIAYLREMQAGGGAGKAGPDIPVPASAHDQFVRARDLAHQGKYADALAELELLVEVYPGTAEIRHAICEVQILATGPGSPEATKACDRAAEVSPDDPRPLLTRAKEFLRADDRVHALELLARVEERAGERAAVWDQVAEVYQAASAVSQAEAAAARSTALAPPVDGGLHRVAEWAARTRARYGLPPDAKRWKILPADEAAYIATVRELLDLVYAGKHDDAAARARSAEQKWKGAPGILAARCDLELRLKDRAAAKKLCAQAVKAWSGAAWALYLQGVIGLNEKQDRRAIVSLRAAIKADPELAQAYRTLGKALVRGKDQTGWDALAAEYKTRFGQALPQ